MVKSRKYVVIKRFHKRAQKSDFEIVEEELPPLADGEILTKTQWISVDPYQRSVQDWYQVPYVQYGYQIGTVMETKDPEYPVGTQVVSHEGWCEYCITNPSKKNTNPMDRVYKVPDLQGLPLSYALSAAGMVGATAYFGLLDILQPKPGDTVVVSCAAGAVGSLLGQIAKIKECNVIGIAGSDEKVTWLEKELRFDKAINYKKGDIEAALKSAAPNGIDCYFDGVSGEISSVVMGLMNKFGRVGVCGWISAYGEDYSKLPKATIVQPSILMNMLTVKGFTIMQWDDWSVAFEDIIKWIKSGHIKVREHVTKGFDNIFEAFDGMLVGENFGKALVEI